MGTHERFAWGRNGDANSGDFVRAGSASSRVAQKETVGLATGGFHGGESGSILLGSANDFNGLALQILFVSNVCPIYGYGQGLAVLGTTLRRCAAFGALMGSIHLIEQPIDALFGRPASHPWSQSHAWLRQALGTPIWRQQLHKFFSIRRRPSFGFPRPPTARLTHWMMLRAKKERSSSSSAAIAPLCLGGDRPAWLPTTVC